jgi:hypothetical protein
LAHAADFCLLHPPRLEEDASAVLRSPSNLTYRYNLLGSPAMILVSLHIVCLLRRVRDVPIGSLPARVCECSHRRSVQHPIDEAQR